MNRILKKLSPQLYNRFNTFENMNSVRMKSRLTISRKLVYILLAIAFNSPSMAQSGKTFEKISPRLKSSIIAAAPGEKINIIITVNGTTLPETLKLISPASRLIQVNGDLHFYEAEISAADAALKLALIPQVLFIEDGGRKAMEELQVGNLDLAVNRISTLHGRFPQWNGDGITVSIKENLPDTADIDFKNRFLSTTLSSSTVSPHASIMATMIGGGGNSWYLGKGAAWGGRLSSASFATLLPETNTAYQQYNITVQNHSYGVGIENYYGSDAMAYDASAVSNPSLLHVFSSGNSGTATPASGTYSGISGMANLTGSFKMAKNILTAGATDSFNLVAIASSKGPAYDGRIKPELVAFGEDGSSGSAALVSGVSMMLQQAARQLYGSLPANTLIKAVLLNSADDAGNAGPDYSYGFGSLNALNAMQTIQSGRWMNGTITQGNNISFPVTVPAGIRKMKLTVCWNDPPAVANAPKALVNDLDIELIHPLSGQTWKPWVLSAFPHIDSLRKPATRKRDSLNNVEQVTVDDPIAGNYLFRVNGFSVGGSPQAFYIAYQFDSTDRFEWVFPSVNDHLFSASKNTLRWTSSYANANGTLEYSLNNGASWQLIDNAVNLSKGYYQWQSPAGTSEIKLRMSIGAGSFATGNLTISQRTLTGVGFNCPDSFHLYWNKLPGVNTYRVYTLMNIYLEPLFTTTDSFFVFSKFAYPALHYSVAPLFGNQEGIKSFTFNYTTQGTGCFIRSFLASLQNNSAELQLTLGTLYQVTRIILEKYNGNEFVSLQQVIPIGSLSYNFTDAALNKGENRYRAKLELSGGRTVYSDVVTVYSFAGRNYIVYPNPVAQGQSLNILTTNPSPDLILQIFDSQGRLYRQSVVNDVLTNIPTGKLGKGLYFLKLMNEKRQYEVFKLIVR